jgi:UTP--glucose-1-phosphate uridylyltransferase
MGSVLALFRGAQALRVPRNRFIPVKKTNDLLLLWSDVYALDEAYLPRLASTLSKPPLVNLEDRYYALISDLRLRFAHGAPSLAAASSFQVSGDVHFGRNVAVYGNVCIDHRGPDPLYIPDGAKLTEPAM